MHKEVGMLERVHYTRSKNLPTASVFQGGSGQSHVLGIQGPWTAETEAREGILSDWRPSSRYGWGPLWALWEPEQDSIDVRSIVRVWESWIHLESPEGLGSEQLWPVSQWSSDCQSREAVWHSRCCPIAVNSCGSNSVPPPHVDETQLNKAHRNLTFSYRFYFLP